MWPSRGKLMVLRALQSNISSNSEHNKVNVTSEVYSNLQNSDDDAFYNQNYNDDDSNEYQPSSSEESSTSVEYDHRFRKKINAARVKKSQTKGNSEKSNAEEGSLSSHSTNIDSHRAENIERIDHITAENSNLVVTEVTEKKKKKMFVLKERTSRKRPRNVQEWTKKRAAVARESGKAYISYKGKEVPSKVPNLGVLCKENCRLKCGEKFSAIDRERIFTRFYKLDVNGKNAQLFNSIQINKVQRQRTNAKNHKTASYKFTVTCNSVSQNVCKTAFCSLYRIGRKKVDLIQKQLKEGKSAPSPDSRGKHFTRPHKIPEEVVVYIQDHIRSFPAEESHYSRHNNPHRMYLAPILNISKMYQLYIEKCEEEKKSQTYKVKKCTYSNIFSTHFNLAFGAPRSDTCSTCDSGKVDTEHKENSKAAFELQRIDREKARNDPELLYITMDLQQTMPLPKLTTSKAFYLRQLWFYNLGIHSLSTSGDKAFFFNWTEDMASRGSLEVISALCTFIESNEELIRNKKHLIIWTDSCAGQNKNFQIICFYQYLILKGIFSVIEHKFPEVGHSYLDSDRDFGRIEKVLRKHETIYLPDQYQDIIRESSKINHVTDMRNHFRDLQNLPSQLNLLQKKKNVQNEKVAFRDQVKWIRVDEFGSYLYKENYDLCTPFKKVSILKNERRRPVAENIRLKRITEKFGTVSEKKLENLRAQLIYVKEEFRWFYEEILQTGEHGVANERKTI